MMEQKHILVWNECLRIFENILDSQQFATWFKPIVPVSIKDSSLTVQVPSHFFCEYIEATYLDLLRKTLQRVLGSDAKLFYQVAVVSKDNADLRIPLSGGLPPQNPPVKLPFLSTTTQTLDPFKGVGVVQPLKINPQLDPVKSFENLVVGACNKLGVRAGESVAAEPGKTLNPLFIFGGPGYGKTHIAQAIGLRVKELFPDKVVLYVPAGRFKTQFMKAVQAKDQLTDFLGFYQRIDVLIIDDIQELITPGAQNAFFQIFNHLHQNNKQLILTSDRPQVNLQNFENRLLSRLKWGLSVELTAPDYQIRLSMLQKRAEREGATIPQEVLEFLAKRIKSNFRELEGVLISLIANSTFTHEEPTIELARHLTDNIVDDAQVDLSIDKVEKAVCQYFNLTIDDINSPSRKRAIVQARQIAMYLSRNLTESSLSSIGEQIGGKDHATVLHACNTVTDLMSTDRLFKQYVIDIQKMLTGSIS